MARVSKPPQERRQELVEAAWQLFFESGYEQTTVADIVKRIGVAQGLFYYYFRSKQDILLAVIDQFMEARLGELAISLRDAEAPPLDRIHNLMRALTRFLREAERLLPGQRSGVASEMSAIVQTHVAELIEPLVLRVLEQGNAQRVLDAPYPKQMARFIISGFIGVEVMPDAPGAEEMMEMIRITGSRLLGVPGRIMDAGADISVKRGHRAET